VWDFTSGLPTSLMFQKGRSGEIACVDQAFTNQATQFRKDRAGF